MNRIVCAVFALLVFSWSLPAKIVDRIVAQVNDDIITLSDLNREMQTVRQELATKYAGDQLEQEVKKQEKGVLDLLIQDKLLLQKAVELGFTANVDVQVSATLERIRKENNIKDMLEFERLLAQQGQSLAGYRDYIRKRITIDSLVQNFVGSRITLLFSEIEKYYNEHPQLFTTPEEISLSEIVIPIEGEAAETEAKVNDIRKRITQGENFATLASQYSKGPTAGKGGSIGSYVTGKLNDDIAKAVATVKEGDVTPVLKTKDGFVIYKVDTRKVATRRPLEEVKPEIQRRLWDQKYAPELEKFVAQLREDAYIQIFGEAK
jgi:peptidyl-prolyl cis-trans isomerase SurA